MKKCCDCNTVKDYSEFYAQERGAGGVGSRCINCTKIKNLIYSAENSEKKKLASSNWRKNNPGGVRRQAARRRARIRNSISEHYTEQQVILKHGSNCHLCGSVIDLNANRSVGSVNWELSLHIDHIIPISIGGSDTLDNVKPSHGLCNLRKGNKRVV